MTLTPAISNYPSESALYFRRSRDSCEITVSTVIFKNGFAVLEIKNIVFL